jgi:photosystem II stability/assembly factor-like uncharacterized protein
MKYLLTIVFAFSIFLAITNAQPAYQWILKRSGSSLGGPIDYNKVDPNLVYFGSGSIIYKSTDKGETFSATGIPIPGASETKCVILDDANQGTFLVAVESTPNDKIYKTTNDGATWTLTLNEGQMSYYGIPVTQDPSNPNDIYTMTNTNFKKSTDFGSTWSTIASNFGPISAPCDIEVFPDTSIILIGDNGTGIFRSTDYGLTWSQTYFTSGEIPTVAINYTNPGIAWATKWSGGGGLLKSTDYGNTWVAQSTFNGQNMWGVHVQPSDGNVVITGCYSCGSSWRSKNGGQTWTQIPIGSTNYQFAIVDSMNQFAAQGNGFYKLESQFFIPVELASFSAQLIDNDVMLNWTTATELNNQGFEIEQSMDNENFTKIGFVPGFGTTTEMKSYSFRVSDISAGVQYYRLKQIDFDGTTTIYNSVEVTGPAPNTFVLNQNHPNPFNPSTTISFSLPVESVVNIKLFNLLGQEVTQIANADFQAGNHNIQFNADGLSSGTYIYTIEAKGANGSIFKSTKKMLLLR